MRGRGRPGAGLLRGAHVPLLVVVVEQRLRRVRRQQGRVLAVVVYPLLLLLRLHPPVLEPDLDLAVGEVRLQSELLALLLAHVARLLELLLEHRRLVSLIRLSALFRRG